MGELETIMEDSSHLEFAAASPCASMRTSDFVDSPRKQEHVYLLLENQKKSISSSPRVQQKMVAPKYKKYVDNISEARSQLKSLVRRKGSLRLKNKRTSAHTIIWPPKYSTNPAADEDVFIASPRASSCFHADDQVRIRRLNYLYYA
ncbi:hypothetical protein R1sor_021119 [Riccia sorocarpa]|uniref:Uncharacterized protein n=1 Tax=Riccia sorocarpa TaxID=122646 RepID=A0ABD3GG52_9MARC